MIRTVAIAALYLSVVAAVLPAAEPPHWAFQPLARPDLPHSDSEWARSAIDRFVLQRLDAGSIKPSPEADNRTLLRRVTLDLIGLPPTPQEVAAFLADEQADAYERLVDRLLASPHYGERWTRNWLDLCHYGDSDGHLTDQLRPVAWRYREWVCQSLNRNLPFDEFTIRQLAGDLVEPRPEEQTPPVLGTGFLRQTLSNREGGADLEEYRVEQVVDRTSMVGAIWLGLTVGCARCHDHKYDPLTQKEFFQLYAYFDQADEVNIDAPLPHEVAAYRAARPEYDRRRREVIDPYREAINELQHRWEAKLLEAVAHPGTDHIWDRQWELLGLIWGGNLGEGQLEGTEIVKRPWDKRKSREQHDLLDYFLQHGSIVDPKRFAEAKLPELKAALAKLKEEIPAAFCTRAPVMQSAKTARTTCIHERGDFRDPGPQVSPSLPKWLPSQGDSPSRLTLARWLVSAENPLTPRVTVNRAWQEFFGRGLVATENDFGLRGEPPSHPELLDWLAGELIRGAWDIKRLHRQLVSSATYRQSSFPRPELATRDPHNVWLARQNSLRISAESIRDSALTASGMLSRRVGGPSVFPPQPDRVTMEAFGNNTWKPSAGGDRYRRGLYTFIQRTSPFAQAITFDASSPQKVCTRRDRSNTPLQALTLLNDPAFREYAAGLAERLMQDAGAADGQRLQLAFELCLARPATDAEINRLKGYLDQQRSPADEQRSESEVWTDLASVMFNLHELITRD